MNLSGLPASVVTGIKNGNIAITPELQMLMEDELAYNEVISRPMLPWLQETSPALTWTWHYMLEMQYALEAVLRGECKRLMIFLPPRHGKSTLTSQHLPVYFLECDKRARVVIASYGLDLAKKMSSEAQRIVKRRGIRLQTNALDEWETTEGGCVKAVGVGGAITGRGADIILIDDPHKGAEESESEIEREKVWSWYINDVKTRLEPGGSIILIMTRWHEDDLAGRILATRNAKEWTVIKFPALAVEDDPLGRKVGEALCPARYDKDFYADVLDGGMTSHQFSALYQQSPTPAEGARFKKSWFRYWSEHGEFYCLHRPDGPHYVAKGECYVIQTIDPAATQNQSSDYFVVGTFAVTPDRELLLLDIFREQAETTKHETIISTLYKRWMPSWLGVEAVSYGLNIFQRMQVLGLPIVKLAADKDKVSRSLPIQARYEAGMVYHKLGADWLDVTESELTHFPLGKNDDIVDVCSYAGVHLLNYALKAEPKKEEPPPDDTRKKGSIAARFAHAGVGADLREDY